MLTVVAVKHLRALQTHLYSSWPAVSRISSRHVSPSITTCFLYESSVNKHIHINSLMTSYFQLINYALKYSKLALLSHSFNNIQQKTQQLEAVAASVGLRINKDKTKWIWKTDSYVAEWWSWSVQYHWRHWSRWWSYNIVVQVRDNRMDNENRYSNPITWRQSYWTITQRMLDMRHVFISKCSWRIINIEWSDRIANKELYKTTCKGPMPQQLTRRKSNWLGHMLRKNCNNC